jgi:ubiquitin-protein ligase
VSWKRSLGTSLVFNYTVFFSVAYRPFQPPANEYLKQFFHVNIYTLTESF